MNILQLFTEIFDYDKHATPDECQIDAIVFERNVSRSRLRLFLPDISLTFSSSLQQFPISHYLSY